MPCACEFYEEDQWQRNLDKEGSIVLSREPGPNMAHAVMASARVSLFIARVSA
jgi:hypothetical protein